jgi:hypothetical protein
VASGEGGAAAAAAPGEARPERAPGEGGPRPNRNRNRNRREGTPGEPGAPGEQRQAGPRAVGDRGDRPVRGPRDGGERRDRDPRRRDDRPGSGRGASGRGREPARRPERKLYSVDSVVDRGFEDIEEEGGERRVHWTIVKRTVADQISRKAVSASYVLKRDDAESEFPSLGAARSAVNKTIVHPEKLTLSKADHAAAKSNSR